MIPLFKVFMSPKAHAISLRTGLSGYLGQGSRVEEFENELKERLFLPEKPITLNSCTSAIDLALHLSGVGPGDEVISTPITCTATNSPIVRRGARIVWADVDPVTGLILPESVRLRVNKKTKAIMAVDWGGRACHPYLKKFGVPVIQDAAHAFGGIRYGDYVCYSFQAIKHLTTGDGGALIPPHGQYERSRLLRWYGLDRTKGESFRCSQNIPEVGYKYHMNDLAASIGLGNLKEIDFVVSRHRQNANYLWQELHGHPDLIVPAFDPVSPYWIFTVLCRSKSKRDHLQKYLGWSGIMASQVHARNDKHDGFKAYAVDSYLPGVEQFDSCQLSVPCGWWLSLEDLRKIVETVKAWS